MRRRNIALTGLIVLWALAVVGSYQIHRLSSALEQANDLLAVGQRFPQVHLMELRTGTKISLPRPDQQRTMLVFFSPDCPGCHEELNNLDQIVESLAAEDLSILTISLDDLAKTTNALRHLSYHFPMFVCDDCDLHGLSKFPVPLIFLIDASGTIRYRRTGVRSPAFEQQLLSRFARGESLEQFH
jgi:peroxiredoxin